MLQEALILLGLFLAIVGALSSQKMKESILWVYTEFMEMFRLLEALVKDPRPARFPKVNRLGQKLCSGTLAGCMYSLSFIFVVYYLLLAVLWGMNIDEMSVMQHAKAGMFCLLFVYMAMLLKKEGNKMLDEMKTS